MRALGGAALLIAPAELGFDSFSTWVLAVLGALLVLRSIFGGDTLG